MEEAGAGNAPTTCWTCRHRRVKCDRRLPGCQKCSISGENCLGYSKIRPLRWTNGVASRGKLLGKAVPIIQKANTPIAKLLSDPLLQDLPSLSRGYIKYFNQYCSMESVLYDSDATNPFREFIKLIPSSLALLHTVISIAALHQARRKADGHFLQSEQSSYFGNGAVFKEADHASANSGQSSSMHDALTHKHHALKHMQKELLTFDLSSIDGTIASVLLLVWHDLIDSGKDSWKYHLDALKGIVHRKGCSSKLRHVEIQRLQPQSLYKDFEIIYALLQILGTTFVGSKQPYDPLFCTVPISEIMKLSDGQLWAGCPAEFLYVISLLNNISGCPSLAYDLRPHILCAFEEFSPMKWAIACERPKLMKSRYHLGSAYKAAVAIYITQVMYQLYENNTARTCVATSAAILHIKSISRDDAHFKSLVWPAFVIGAEVREEPQRREIAEVFEHLWDIWRCQNVRNALNVLKDLWMLNDQREYSGPWINDLYGWDMNLIFV